MPGILFFFLLFPGLKAKEPMMEKELREVSAVRERFEDSRKNIVTDKKERLEEALEYLDIVLAERYLKELSLLKPNDPELREYRKIIDEMGPVVRRLKSLERDREFFLPDPMDAVKRLEGSGRISRKRNRQLKKRKNTIPDWVRKLEVQLEKKSDFSFSETGKNLLALLRKNHPINLSLSGDFYRRVDLEENLDFAFKNMTLRHFLNHLADRWNAIWIFRDGAVVFITKEEALAMEKEASLRQKPSSSLVIQRPQVFDAITLDGFSLEGKDEVHLGISGASGPTFEKKARDRRLMLGVLPEGDIQILVTPETKRGDRKEE
jgi:hypothetical protein